MPPPAHQIPSREDCLRLMREHRVMAHIIDHSLRVAEVALLIGRGLLRTGEDLDLPLLEAASLLHDIAKLESLTTRADHALAGQELVTALGYAPALGHLIRHHVRLPEEPETFCPLECEVLNYSDKRVNGSLIVSLGERFDYIRGRYGRSEEIIGRINQLEERTRVIEVRLFTRLPFTPEELAAALDATLNERHLKKTLQEGP
jgi:putative nucleotidyltransferase with HDIG domain